MPNQYRRLGMGCHRLRQVFDIVMDAVPYPVLRPIMAAQLHSAHLMVPCRQVSNEVFPTPGTVPGAMDKQDPAHAVT
jgi:hypothetical protein